MDDLLGNDITTALSPWSRNVSHSLNAVVVKELQIYTRKLRKTLFKAASADRGLEKRLRADLLVRVLDKWPGIV